MVVGLGRIRAARGLVRLAGLARRGDRSRPGRGIRCGGAASRAGGPTVVLVPAPGLRGGAAAGDDEHALPGHRGDPVPLDLAAEPLPAELHHLLRQPALVSPRQSCC